jgi:cytochrome c-type biogenesis protein CcmH
VRLSALVAVLAASLFVLVAVVPAFAAAVTTKEVEEALTCQCGCGLTVHSCNHLQCGSGIPLKNEVLTLVNQGLSRDDILLRFRTRYGEKILSSPTTEGFNLTAWILPFVVVAAGGAVIVVCVRRWTRDGGAGAEGIPGATAISAEDRERLRTELAKADR